MVDKVDTFFLGTLTGVFMMSIVIVMMQRQADNEPPAPWTIEERECSRTMIKEIREHFDPTEPIELESILEDCRYFINKVKREQR